MANITVTTNQQVIDVTTSGGVNVTNTTDTITVLPSGTLNITTGITDRLVAGSNQVILNTNATMTFPNNAIDFGSQTADLKSSAWSELWWHNANASPTAGQGTNTYIWSWENQAGIAVESVGNSGKEWYFNNDGTTQFPGYKFPYADGSANQILKTNGSGILSWYSPSDLNTTYTISSAATTGGANLTLTGSDSSTDSVKFASGTGITVSRTDADTITITNNVVGDVVGPASATDNAVVRFDTTTGKLIKNSTVTIDNSGNIVTNGDLAVNGGDITTTQTTGTVFNTTATTVNLGGAATTVSIGAATGTTTINNTTLSLLATGANLNIANRVRLISARLDTTTTTANQVFVTNPASSHRNTKLQVSIVSGSDYHSADVTLTNNGTTSYITVSNEMWTNVSLTDWSTDISGANVRLLVTPTNAVTTYRCLNTSVV